MKKKPLKAHSNIRLNKIFISLHIFQKRNLNRSEKIEQNIYRVFYNNIGFSTVHLYANGKKMTG